MLHSTDLLPRRDTARDFNTRVPVVTKETTGIKELIPMRHDNTYSRKSSIQNKNKWLARSNAAPRGAARVPSRPTDRVRRWEGSESTLDRAHPILLYDDPTCAGLDSDVNGRTTRKLSSDNGKWWPGRDSLLKKGQMEANGLNAAGFFVYGMPRGRSSPLRSTDTEMIRVALIRRVLAVLVDVASRGGQAYQLEFNYVCTIFCTLSAMRRSYVIDFFQRK